VDTSKLDLLFETFFDITSLARMERGETALYSRVLDCCRDVLCADMVTLLRMRNRRVERYTKRGGVAPMHRDELPRTQVLLDWLEREAAPFVGPAGEWRHPFPEPLVERQGGSLLCAPLVGKESQLGLMVALRDRVREDFGARDLKFLSVIAGQTAIALENVDLYERLRREALTDGLTGILNYRSFMRALRGEHRRAQRYRHVFAFVMADVDHLKDYNERFGHLAGSQVLVQVARLLVRGCRSTDIVGKYGGDEFALVLPQTGLQGARAVSERIRRAIASHAFKHVRPGVLTCSFGVAVFPRDATDVAGLIRHADDVLFAAKHSGRNSVRTSMDLDGDDSLADQTPPAPPLAPSAPAAPTTPTESAVESAPPVPSAPTAATTTRATPAAPVTAEPHTQPVRR